MINIILCFWLFVLILFLYFLSDLDKRGLLLRIVDRNDVLFKVKGK